MILIMSSLLIIILCVLGIINNKDNLLLFILFIEIILITVTFIFSLLLYLQKSYFGQMYGLYILTIAAVESAIVIAIVVQFYRFRNSISVSTINHLTKRKK